jgi:hypothetical protein
MPKECGGCTACCTLIGVPALSKPAGTRCPHCVVGGCGIYEERPDSCRKWICGWLADPGMPDEFRPDRCGFIVQAALAGRRVLALAVDWKRMRERPRLLERLQRFCAVMNKNGFSVLSLDADGRVRGSLAPGHDNDELLEAAKQEAVAAGTWVDLS